MRYQGKIYRPPFEADGLLLQVTLGCTHNKCTYCDMYKSKKFKMRPFEEIEEDLIMAKNAYNSVPSVFLMDANALSLSMNKLRPVYHKIRELFPEVGHINTYARYSDILRKSQEDLLELKNLGLSCLTVGMESGSDTVLKKIKKGFASEDILKASAMLKSAGIKQFTSVMLGIGEISGSYEHTTESIRLLNKIEPVGIGLSAVIPQEKTPLYEEIENGLFELPTWEVVYNECIRILREFKMPYAVFMAGFMGPKRPIMRNGVLGKDAEDFCRDLENAYILNPDAMKQKVFMNMPF